MQDYQRNPASIVFKQSLTRVGILDSCSIIGTRELDVLGAVDEIVAEVVGANEIIVVEVDIKGQLDGDF